ncbi:hypothetical protein P5673_012841, partial [Acropora cervicornis]
MLWFQCAFTTMYEGETLLSQWVFHLIISVREMERRRQCIDGDGIQDVASPVDRRHGSKEGDDYIFS